MRQYLGGKKVHNPGAVWPRAERGCWEDLPGRRGGQSCRGYIAIVDYVLYAGKGDRRGKPRIRGNGRMNDRHKCLTRPTLVVYCGISGRDEYTKSVDNRSGCSREGTDADEESMAAQPQACLVVYPTPR
jgi:hypothetical protein